MRAGSPQASPGRRSAVRGRGGRPPQIWQRSDHPGIRRVHRSPSQFSDHQDEVRLMDSPAHLKPVDERPGLDGLKHRVDSLAEAPRDVDGFPRSIATKPSPTTTSASYQTKPGSAAFSSSRPAAAWNSVWVNPGQSSHARIPRDRSARSGALESAATYALIGPYFKLPVRGMQSATETTFRMRPKPRSRMPGMRRWQIRATEVLMGRRTSACSSDSHSSGRSEPAEPALWTRQSTPSRSNSAATKGGDRAPDCTGQARTWAQEVVHLAAGDGGH